MQTFDMALYDLYMEGKVSMDEALRNADSANNLRLKINLSEKDGRKPQASSTPPPQAQSKLAETTEQAKSVTGGEPPTIKEDLKKFRQQTLNTVAKKHEAEQQAKPTISGLSLQMMDDDEDEAGNSFG